MRRYMMRAWRNAGFFFSVMVAAQLAGVTQKSIFISAQDLPTKSLFSAVARTELNDAQKQRLDHVSAAPTTERVRIVKLEKDTLADRAKPPVIVPLPPNIEFKMSGYVVGNAESDDPNDRTLLWDWTGKDNREGESCNLAVKENSATGLIYTRNKFYSFQPLGAGYHAIVEVDQTKFPKEHPDNIKDGCRNAHPGGLPRSSAIPASTSIRVFVAYTPKVSQETDVAALIAGAVHISNVSFRNSDIALSLKLAATAQMKNVRETGSMEGDLRAFKAVLNDRSGEALRAKGRADLCVMLVDENDYCGLAEGILTVNASDACCVVGYRCAIDRLSFAHEIGHLLGCRHNRAQDPTVDTAHPYNHGYLSNADWCDIMAYPDAQRPRRIPYWSNPRKQLFGERMGTQEFEDCARMLGASGPLAGQLHQQITGPR